MTRRMTGYSATVEVTAHGHSPADPRVDDPAVGQRLSDFLDRLADMWGAVSGDGRGWSATVTVDADGIDTAREIATTGVLQQAAASGLPTGPVTRVEVVREDIRDTELERPTLPELVSGPEAAEILGVSRQRVHQLAHQHPDFPAPAYRLGVGSLWFRAGVERFARDWSRKPGRPAKQSA
jgi:hypothetical protein